jgi:hypothetical protein
LGVNTATGEVLVETIERRRQGIILESRVRSRLGGPSEWVDQMQC